MAGRTVNCQVPALWWQRPQYWGERRETEDGEVTFLASTMWRIRELMSCPLDANLRKIQPVGDADDD
jgi:hypothetical protein